MLSAVAHAAPKSPNRGIKIRFNTKLAILETMRIFLTSSSLPVIFNKYITGPQIALIIAPVAKIVRGKDPPLE